MPTEYIQCYSVAMWYIQHSMAMNCAISVPLDSKFCADGLYIMPFCIDRYARSISFCADGLCYSVPMNSLKILRRWTIYAILYLIQCHSLPMDCAIQWRWIYTFTSPLWFSTFSRQCCSMRIDSLVHLHVHAILVNAILCQ